MIETTRTAAELLPAIEQLESVLSGLKANLERARQEGATTDKTYEETPVEEADLLWRLRQQQDNNRTRISRISQRIQEVEAQLAPLRDAYQKVLKSEQNAQVDAELEKSLALLKQKDAQAVALIRAGMETRVEVLNELVALRNEWREPAPTFPMAPPHAATPEERRRTDHFQKIVSLIQEIGRKRVE